MLIKKNLLLTVIFLTYFLFINLKLHSQCNNFLKINSVKSGVRIGDLDITGNRITVEGFFNRTQNYNSTFGGGEIVSKHQDPTNVNYLLRPNGAYITTTNGFFRAEAPCSIEINKNYHAALVYDGSTLKFYRDGELLSTTNASGNLITNDYSTTIGTTADLTTIHPSDFIGFINEVRIWSVARSSQEINDFINVSLPNPNNQIGLQAYYIFNSLTNLQGNNLWNGNQLGNINLNVSNPSCNIINNLIPTLNINADKTSICTGSSVQFTANISNQNNVTGIRWLVNGSQVPGNSTIFLSSNLQNNDKIICEITYKIGCQPSKTLQSSPINMVVSQNLNPSLSISASSTEICKASSVTLTATHININNPLSYRWMVNGNLINNNNNNFISNSLNDNDIIQCIIIGINNCGNDDSAKSNIIKMKINPLPEQPVISGKDTICIGELFTFKSSVNSSTWVSQNNTIVTISNNGIVTGIAKGNTTIINTVSNNCGINTKTFEITVLPTPSSIVITGVNSVDVGKKIKLNANIDGGIWSSSNPLIATIDNLGIVSGVSFGNVVINYNIKNACGISNGSYNISVTSNDLFFPNFFSPNNDGKNDLYKVFGSSIRRLELNIFNQWGELVFTTKNNNIGWDGTFKGKQQPVGVYVYTAIVYLLDGTNVSTKGSISLIR